jgi:hypothetical protein
VSGRAGDPGQARRQAVYLRALATVPSLTIHYGHFLAYRVMPLSAPPPAGPQDRRGEQDRREGIDVNLATYLLLDGFQVDHEAAAVISNDSDLAESRWSGTC